MFNRGGEEKVTRLPKPRHDQVNGLLDKGCAFEGKLTFDGTVQINGDFRGEIYSDGTLVVGAEARVKGAIFVDTLIVYGKIDGKIEAKSRIEMHVPAVAIADIKAKQLSIEEGVIFQGTCQMDRAVATTSVSDAPVAHESALVNADDDEENVLVM